MGFLDYIKRIISSEEEKAKVEIEKTEKESGELSLDEIKAKLASEQKELSKKNEELKKKAKLLVKEEASLLKDCLVSLKKVNLDKRREDEKLKAVVMENLVIYASHLEEFVADLENFEDINQISRMFETFSKNSSKSYQRATILIGKEFEVISNVLKKSVSELNVLLKENQENSYKIKKLGELETRFDEIAKISDAEREIKEDILKLKENKEKKEEELIKNKNNKYEIIESPDYKKDLEKKEQIKEEIKQLEDKTSEILTKIDLKEIARVCHGNERKHGIIQDYIRNYKKAIEEDKEDNLKKIVKEVWGLDINLIEINNKIKELSSFIPPSELRVKQLEETIKSIETQIKDISEYTSEEEKKIVKFENKKQEIESQIKLEAKNLI